MEKYCFPISQRFCKNHYHHMFCSDTARNKIFSRNPTILSKLWRTLQPEPGTGRPTDSGFKIFYFT